MTWVQLNDRLVPEGEARVSVFDRGFMYGDSVFDTLRVYQGHPFQLDAHLRRFEASASAISLDLPYSLERIAGDIRSVLEKNGLERGDAVIRVSLSRGTGARGLSIADIRDPTYVVAPYPLPEKLAQRQESGTRLTIVATRRVPGSALPVDAKHANYLNSILAYNEAVRTGADDGLLLSIEGKLAECAGANLFLVNGSRILTPDLKTGILPGCARSFVLGLCRSNGLSADEARLDPDVLDEVDEVFVTNSVWEIVPVCAVDHREYAVPGPVTAMLSDLFREGVEAEIREQNQGH